MKLDRNNYEEYFLMYADGELAPADRKAVEHFVTLHPDLADELEMLMEAVLDIDANITMPNKELLYKTTEWQEETLTPQQKDLLLYVDNELPASQKLALESQLKNDKALQTDLASLTKAKLTGEVVEMPEKEELYHKENNRRPIPIMVMRWMAAAAVVAGLGWFSLSVFNGKTNTGGIEVAGLDKTNQSNQAAPKENEILPPASQNSGFPDSVEPQVPANSPAAVSASDVNNNTAATTSKEKNANAETPDFNKKPAIPSTNSQTVREAEPVQIASNNPLKTEPQKNLVPVVANQNNDEAAKALNALAAQHNIAKNEIIPTNNPIVVVDNLPPSKDEITADSEPEYVNIAGARIKKQKVRGLFRSVTRTVGRAFDKSNVAQVDK